MYKEIKNDECPLGGDISDDCADCFYSADYHYENGECVLRDPENRAYNLKDTQNSKHEKIK